jgi:altronate hydrolase
LNRRPTGRKLGALARILFWLQASASLKLATNSEMYKRMQGDMDINCGRILDDEIDVQQMGAEIFEHIIACASGAPSKSEMLGYGEAEIVPWNMGAVL